MIRLFSMDMHIINMIGISGPINFMGKLNLITNKNRLGSTDLQQGITEDC